MTRPSSNSPDALPAVGDVVAGFRLERELGRGGMGVVFLARREHELVALKILLSVEERTLVRFAREADALARVGSHPNIASVLGFSVEGPHPWLAIQYIAGRDLGEALEEGRPLPLAEAARIIEKVASALDAIHEAGLTHRDLKPGNILIRDLDGEVFLTDFGIVRDDRAETLTRTGELVGTPAWMAPEQLSGEAPVGPHTDIWALGVLLYRLITGELPFKAPSTVELLPRILFEAPPAPSLIDRDLPAEADLILRGALAKDPGQRYRTAGALLADVRSLLAGEPVQGAAGAVAADRRRRLRLGLALGAVALAIGAVAGGLVLRSRGRADQQRRAVAGVRLLQSLSPEDATPTDVLLARECERRLRRPDQPSELDPERLARAAAALVTLRRLPPAITGPLLAEAPAVRERAREIPLLARLAGLAPEGLEPSREWQAFLAALDDADRDPEAARASFETLSRARHRSGDLAVWVLALIDIRAGRWSAAEGRLDTLRGDATLGPIATRLQEEGLAGAVFHKLTAGDSHRGGIIKLCERLSASAEQPELRAALFQALQERLDAWFSEPPGADRERRLDAYARLMELTGRVPLRAGPAHPELHRAALDAALARSDTPAAVFHFFTLRRRDPTLVPPKAIEPYEMWNRLTFDFVRESTSKKRVAIEARKRGLKIALAVARAGGVTSVLDENAIQVLRERGIIAALIKACPYDPCCRLWECYPRPWQNFPREDIARRVKDFRSMLPKFEALLTSSLTPVQKRHIRLARVGWRSRLLADSELKGPLREELGRRFQEEAAALEGKELAAPDLLPYYRIKVRRQDLAFVHGEDKRRCREELLRYARDAIRLLDRRFARTGSGRLLADSGLIVIEPLTSGAWSSRRVELTNVLNEQLLELDRVGEVDLDVDKMVLDYAARHSETLLMYCRIFLARGELERAQRLMRSYRGDDSRKGWQRSRLLIEEALRGR